VEAPLARRAQLKGSSGDSKRLLIRLLLYQVYTCYCTRCTLAGC
jgi:hypothetical protein